jgi:hypothetical protein
MELDPCRMRLPEPTTLRNNKRLSKTATPQIRKRMPETKKNRSWAT